MAMMISKFHKMIQSKIIWGAFAILISVAFVGVSIPGSKSRSAARRDQEAAQRAGTLFGEDVSRAEFGYAYRSVQLNYTLQYGPFRITDSINEILTEAAWQRIAMLKKARQLNLVVTPKQIISTIQSQPLFQNQQTGQYDSNAYNAMLPQIRSLTGMSPKEVENHFAEEILIQKVSSIPAQSVLVSEADIKKAFHLYADRLTVEYAAIPRTHAATPPLSDGAAERYFATFPEEFRMPEKVIVSYVEFSVANYTNQVEVSEADVAAFYTANQQRFLKKSEATDVSDAAPEFQPFEDVQAAIAIQLRQELARNVAADLADELVAALADETTTFEAEAQTQGLKIIQNRKAFTLTDSVPGIDPTAPFQRAAFGLKKDASHYYSDPVVGRDFVYVISLIKKYDSFLPAFELVQADAIESAKLAASETAYLTKIEQIHGEILAAIKTGSSFSDAVETQNLTWKTTEPFTLATPVEGEIEQQIKGAALLYEQGQLIDLIAMQDEYLVAYMAHKEPADELTELPAMRDELASTIAREKSAQLVTAWKSDLLQEADFKDLRQQADDES